MSSNQANSSRQHHHNHNQTDDLATLPRTVSTSSANHNLLLEEFADDFDVSLSGLCLGPADSVGGPPVGGVVVEGPNNLPITLFNSLGSLSDIKVEGEELNFQSVAAATVLHAAALANGGQQSANHHHHSSSSDNTRDKKLNIGGGGGSAPGTPVQHSAVQLLAHHLDRGTPFDPHDAFYSSLTNDTEDSCQSDTYSSSDTGSIVPSAKSSLQTVLEDSEKGLSSAIINKRLCFKGLVEKEQLSGGVLPSAAHLQQHQQISSHHHSHHHQAMNSANQAAMVQAAQAAGQAAALAIGPLSINDPLNDSFFTNPLNVANAYGYAWRRWSKTDAPTVKNKVGSIQVSHTMAKTDDLESRDFQYILGAPTAAGTKLGHMTMTYLNQGQSYEIRLKKLKKIPNEANLKTCVRLGFVEKRLQYRENEEMANWSLVHSKDRLLDIDFTMSYGVFDINLNSTYNHCINFVWNPGREASIFIKINCISTEFTSKRHGGERGAPLKLIVDTLSTLDGSTLDAANCLIKVFKSKGAERKHKTDRDRISKLPDAELHYQPSYDCTLLTAYKEEPLVPPTASSGAGSSGSSHLDTIAASPSATPPMSCSTPGLSSSGSPTPSGGSSGGGGGHRDSPASMMHRPSQDSGYMTPGASVKATAAPSSDSNLSGSISSPISTTDSSLSSSTITPTPQTPQLPQSTSHIEDNPFYLTSGGSGSSGSLTGGNNGNSGLGPGSSSGSGSKSPSGILSANAGAIETYEWLKRNRFFRLAEQLCDYTADDLRRLSRDDLIQLCDLKDGIRLYNMIHTPEGATTKLTIFITMDGNEHYALYFKTLTVEEFRDKLTESFQDPMFKLRNMHVIGPNGIRVKLTTNVIQNMKNESIYLCSVSKVDDEFDVLLRLTSQ